MITHNYHQLHQCCFGPVLDDYYRQNEKYVYEGYRMKAFSMALDGVIAIGLECWHTACLVMVK